MVVKENIDLEKKWLCDDGQNPIQLRVIVPGDISKVEHYHKSMHEYFLVMQGEMEIKVAERVVKLGPGGLVVVEPGETHVILSTSIDAKILLLMPPPVPGDKVNV